MTITPRIWDQIPLPTDSQNVMPLIQVKKIKNIKLLLKLSLDSFQYCSMNSFRKFSRISSIPRISNEIALENLPETLNILSKIHLGTFFRDSYSFSYAIKNYPVFSSEVLPVIPSENLPGNFKKFCHECVWRFFWKVFPKFFL